MLALILFAGIGFLLAVLWIDLVFDAMVLPYHDQNEPLPEKVLGTMSSFYHHITFNPIPLFIVMLIMLGILILQLVQHSIPALLGWLSLVLFLIPTVYAAVRIIPVANRLGSRKDTHTEQSKLARSLFAMHLFSFIVVLLFGAVQFYAAWGGAK
jgi:hypothetical protein